MAQDRATATTADASARAALPDAELVSAAMEGHGWACATIYARHAPVLLVRLRRILGHAADAEDVLQMVFVAAFDKLARFDRTRSLGAWLHGFACNMARRQLRGKRRKWWLLFGKSEQLERAADRMGDSPEVDAMDAELAGLLYEAMDQLPEKQRVAYALHEIDGMGLTEIGEALSLSPQAVYARVIAARQRIQRHLGVEPPSTRPRYREGRP